MNKYEYKLADLPPLGKSGREQAYFDGLQETLNELGMSGWEYVGQESFEVRKKQWLRSPHIETRPKLVFRRLIAQVAEPAEVARLVIKDKGEPLKITPRRVRNPKMVAEVKAGARKINVIKPVAAQGSIAERA